MCTWFIIKYTPTLSPPPPHHRPTPTSRLSFLILVDPAIPGVWFIWLAFSDRNHRCTVDSEEWGRHSWFCQYIHNYREYVFCGLLSILHQRVSVLSSLVRGSNCTAGGGGGGGQSHAGSDGFWLLHELLTLFSWIKLACLLHLNETDLHHWNQISKHTSSIPVQDPIMWAC